MESKALALAAPLMLLSIGVERWLLRRDAPWFSAEDTYANVGSAAFQQVWLVFFSGALAAGYLFLGRFAPASLPVDSVWTWVLALVGIDFLYYWWHRVSHRVNALWAAHVVHHQSESYNLSVALRQSLVSDFTAYPFYVLLALAGVPLVAFASAKAVHTIYQFWIHAERFPRLGPLEWLFNSPAHHRLHHARNPPYLDKNYAAIFIVWDRLFGSFVAQSEEPKYGITQPLQTFDPIRAQWEPWRELWRAMRSGGWLLLVQPPEKLPYRPAPFLMESAPRRALGASLWLFLLGR